MWSIRLPEVQNLLFLKVVLGIQIVSIFCQPLLLHTNPARRGQAVGNNRTTKIMRRSQFVKDLAVAEMSR
jgi:hypothetical protein